MWSTIATYLIVEGDGRRLAPARDVAELERGAAPRRRSGGGERRLVEGIAAAFSHRGLVERREGGSGRLE